MNDRSAQRFRVGDRVEDLCRACKAIRTHTIMAVGVDPSVVRVVCGYCGSHHNYRGGERAARPTRAAGEREPRVAEGGNERGRGELTRRTPDGAAHSRLASPGGDVHAPDAALPLVSERERRYPRMTNDPTSGEGTDLELLMRRVIREEMGLGPAVPAEKWRGGEMILRPGKPGLQEKTWPIETFFHKVVMLRNRLRVLEQQVNGLDVPDDLKVKIQGYITGCYGTLTSFNVLFAEEDDRFHGSGGGDDAG